MQLSTDCHQDLRLLDLRGLAPLDPDMAGGEVDLRAMLESHNDRCARAVARLRQLSEDRRCLGNFDTWKHTDSASLLAERARLRGATWDALCELRHVLEERGDVLGQVEQRFREQYHAADQEHDQAVAVAKKRAERERRSLQRRNPNIASSYFSEIVAEDPTVVETAAKRAEAKASFDAAADARRQIMFDEGAIQRRQREVFAAMVG